MFATQGIRGVKVGYGDTVEVSGQGTFPRHPEALIALVVPFLPREAEAIRLQIEDRTVEAPLNPFRRYREAPEGVEKNCHFVELRARCLVGGRPLLDSQGVRRWIARTAVEHIASDDMDAIRNLRLLRDLCSNVGDRQGEELMNSCIRQKREAIVGLTTGAEQEAVLHRVLEWALSPT